MKRKYYFDKPVPKVPWPAGNPSELASSIQSGVHKHFDMKRTNHSPGIKNTSEWQDIRTSLIEWLIREMENGKPVQLDLLHKYLKSAYHEAVEEYAHEAFEKLPDAQQTPEVLERINDEIFKRFNLKEFKKLGRRRTVTL